MLVFGVSLVESLREAVLKSSPWWAAGGRPRGSFLCVCVDGRREFEHRLVKEEVKDERGAGVVGRRGRRRVFVPVPALCSPLRTCYSSPVAILPLVSGEG